MRMLSFIGQRSAFFLIVGMIGAAFFPELSSTMRPSLPFLVVLILALGFAQTNFKLALSELLNSVQIFRVILILFAGTVLTTLMLVTAAQVFDLSKTTILLLVIFAAAPPLSSSISLGILLGFNARITVQVTLMGMLLVPFIGPFCFAIADIPIELELFELGSKIATMIISGFILAFLIQKILGQENIVRNKDIFAGLAVLAMIIFIFPLFSGVHEYVVRSPFQALLILLLSLSLNLGGHFLMRWTTGRFTNSETASALGFMFGNRNVAIYLAVLPLNPVLSMFIAAYQIPIYITPALLRKTKSKNENT